MHNNRYRIQFPKEDAQNLRQDEAYFYIVDENNNRKKLLFHDYDEIYKFPGLYEQIFYDRLKCISPKKVSDLLRSAVSQTTEHFSSLRVLDLGAGNGIMAEAMKNFGVSRMIGVDIIQEAKMAAERDRPYVYDAYYVSDFTNISEQDREEFESWSLNCLTTVAALGFGDIPPKAFITAFNLIEPSGWAAFNIKETFLSDKDDTGFSQMIRELIFSNYLDVHHLEKYQHRLSMEGEPLYYYAIAAKKTANIPSEFTDRFKL